MPDSYVVGKPPSFWHHIQWLAFMLIVCARGPGKISLDALLFRK